jgi:UMF1 family MFS transporter
MAGARLIPRRAVVSWVLYDLANTIFSMGVASIYFSLYVRETVGAERTDTVYSSITAVSMIIIFVVSPMLGAMTDRARRRMPFLVGSTLLCCGATALFARGPFALSVVLFVFANAAYQAGIQFYDALLPEVSTEENRGRVSGIGVGVGYLGSYFAVLLGMAVPAGDRALLFTIIAVAFLALAVPCFVFVEERGNPNPRPVWSWAAIRQSTRETIEALRTSGRYPGLRRFLIGRVFYTDAINTVIAYMALFTVNVTVAGGLTEAAGQDQAERVMLSAITFAVCGGLVWGRLVDRIGPRRTLNIVLALWIVTFACASAIAFFRLPVAVLYVMAAMAGVALGGIWSADRPYMLRLTPPDRIGEFYGLYGMVGRFSAVSGPVLWGIVMHASTQWFGLPVLTGQAIAILTLLAMIVTSAVILRAVTDDGGPGVRRSGGPGVR